MNKMVIVNSNLYSIYTCKTPQNLFLARLPEFHVLRMRGTAEYISILNTHITLSQYYLQYYKADAAYTPWKPSASAESFPYTECQYSYSLINEMYG